MASNDLFRMISLRRSKRSSRTPTTPPEQPPPDPRLRLRELIAAQTKVTSSQRAEKLRELKRRHAQLANQMAQRESVQRAVIHTFFTDRLEEAQKPSAPVANARTRGDERVASASETNTGALAVGAAQRFRERVESRLNGSEKTIFHEVMAGHLLEDVADLNTIMTNLGSETVAGEANRICTEIRAIEENDGEAWPVVPSGPTGAPSVVAMGWGDLVVARESLVGYQAREIAHVENIMPGELKIREHQRLAKTEEVTESEITTEQESEKDSQTTDRYELQAESQETINRDFAIKAGVNTSSQYGVTQIDTSLDSAFGQSQSQSRSSSINTAREIVSRAVERTFERVRRLRRLTITEEIRELNRHELNNIGGTAPPTALSGMYLWIEKIQRVELRHYGARMMIEFHVPEPAISLLERGATGKKSRRLPAFDVAPSAIQPGNYMCLAQHYGAVDVAPPPPLFIQVGHGWVAPYNEEAEAWAECQFTEMISIPDGYIPIWAKVGWSGLPATGGIFQPSSPFSFAFHIGGQAASAPYGATTSYGRGVYLNLPIGEAWPQGVPFSGRVKGIWDGSMYVQATLHCMRTSEALDKWRLRTWQALREGYEAMQRALAQEEQMRLLDSNLLVSFAAERASAENRRIERGELQKWAIKSMRRVPQNFNAVEQVGDYQEISPAYAEAQAPIVRFYEDAFEWEHMSYFLYPYHWARRDSWRMRNAVSAGADPQHQAFLEAGAARVIVPVKPGYEGKVLNYLDPANTSDELTRILGSPPEEDEQMPASTDAAFRDLWVELLTEHKPDLGRGSGTLSVTKDSADAVINADSNWTASEERDVGRELFIDGERYEVAAVTGPDSIRLDRPYEGQTDSGALYVAGSTPFGPPWTVNVPTSLVVLADNVPVLKQIV